MTPSPPNTGYTLFASSTHLFQHLPQDVIPSIDKLKELKWSITTPSFGDVKLNRLPLVIGHPTTGRPCLRYHENWPQSKTRFDPMDVMLHYNGDESISGKDVSAEQIGKALERLLYDRRVTYWHSWEKGDVLISDNFSMMHTRSEFVSGADRELWRIHVD